MMAGLSKESYSLMSVQQLVIIHQGHNHYGSDYNLACHHYRLVLDGMHPKHSHLQEINNQGYIQTSEDTTI